MGCRDCRVAGFGLCFYFPVFFYFFIDSLLQWIPIGIYIEHGNHANIKGTTMLADTIAFTGIAAILATIATIALTRVIRGAK